MRGSNLPFKNSPLRSHIKAKQIGFICKMQYIYFTSCNSMVTLCNLNGWHYRIYLSCPILTASSNIKWLHSQPAEETALDLGGGERGSVVIWNSATTQQLVLAQEGTEVSEWVLVWRSYQLTESGSAGCGWDPMEP